MENIEWKCPRCGAIPGEHGKGKCTSGFSQCDGFICGCDIGDDESDENDHGITYSNKCPNAVCYHCGWSGKFPPLPKKVPPWAKKALEAGWTPPKNWDLNFS